ncbi:sodium:solute symporter [Roseospira marina]|uniref:histidine kinase n=1 Tax=Roseospira marina TaxID=140057 RepID=A0A5M6ICC7_9PROT|nr:sensor histidine kinase [Roseospira marina]KAA5605934.1 sodium:solute symporter [Roseospira marina]MBB4313223.1 Na+/proline symporter/signal transduction histidine kinase [Roseospira marina]MBB5086036.1 Na+/proline symporter/nitrogen-specific signal transduction histidine kinase [Roseospira marina]
MTPAIEFALVAALAYAALLFALAWWVDRRSRQDGGLPWLRTALVYTLSISIYCTSWTFYGAVGSAARGGLEFATIYLGPTLMFVGWWLLLRKLVRIGRLHHITSIADLISSRFGKSEALGALVTVIAVAAATPYIALQLKAVTTSYQVITGASLESVDFRAGFWVAVGMAAFTILFGTRSLDVNERHHGVVAAIALEALVKLCALVAVGVFVVFALFDGPGDLFAHAPPGFLHAEEVFGPRWITLIFLSAAAVICLPRQFQVVVVENENERHLATASWLFPAYLFLMSVFTLPIAIAGLTLMPAGADPDMFVLTLPLVAEKEALALLAFLGGFSSATSMIIVASIALSTMVSNHIVAPLALRLSRNRTRTSGDVRRLLLTTRRIAIATLILLGFLYFRVSAQSGALAAIGLIAFVGVAQVLPSLIGGLFWPQANARGAVWGLTAGFVIWMYALGLPSLEDGGPLGADILAEGPFGLAVLRPQALFGLDGLDPLVHATFWSLTINTVLFVIGSLTREPRPLEWVQARQFVDVFRGGAAIGPDSGRPRFHRTATSEELYILAQRILGAAPAHELFDTFARRQGLAQGLPLPTQELVEDLERRLAGSVGAASARAMMAQVAGGEEVSIDELVSIADETARIMRYSQALERKSTELETTARQLREANEQLREIDRQKDDFLGQVSHEIRTPMTAIRSFSEILRSSDDLESAQARRFVAIIHDESLRLTRLLDVILDMRVVEKGEIPINLEPLDPDAVLDHALQTCEGLRGTAPVTVTQGARAGTARVAADPDRLRQVFINLLSNAVRHTDKDAILIRVESRIEAGAYEAVISDNGPGVPEADRERVFSLFSATWTRAGEKGAGLGLAISRGIMRRMGGDLMLDVGAPREEGARFRVTLALTADDPPP